MTLFNKICFVFLLLLIGRLAYGQDSNKVIKNPTRYITEYDIDRNKTWLPIDTNYNRIEIFQPSFKKRIVFQDLGNAGSSTSPLLFESSREIGFNYQENPWGIYGFKANEAMYCNTKIPYTDITYAQGKEELLYLKLKHAQNITPRWNIGIDYQRLTSQGFLLRQYTSHYNLQAFTAYQSKDRRYTLLANFVFNKALQEEGGGIKNDSSYELLTGSNRAVFTKLDNAQSRYKNRSAYLKQYYNFGSKKYEYRDKDTLYDFENTSHVAYTLEANETKYLFENFGNRDALLLPNQYYDTGTTSLDSTYFGKLTNSFQFQLFNSKQKQIQDSVRHFFTVGLKHELIAVAQIPYRRNYQNLIASAILERSALKNNSISYRGAIDIGLLGFNIGDLKIAGLIQYRTSLFDIAANALIHSFTPDYIFLKNKSNAFIWENDYKKVNITLLGGTFNTRKFRHNFKLSINQYTIQNWVYASNDGTPRQDKEISLLTSAILAKTFQAGHFYFEHELIYQNTNSTSIVVPTFGGLLRYYFATRLFKAVNFQIGTSIFYNTSYFGNSYNPSSRLFYLQNEVKIGNYPLIEPYAIAEIKTFTLFGKFEHVNQDYQQGGFYYTPHYPLSLRSFRFGIRWRLSD